MLQIMYTHKFSGKEYEQIQLCMIIEYIIRCTFFYPLEYHLKILHQEMYMFVFSIVTNKV